MLINHDLGIWFKALGTVSIMFICDSFQRKGLLKLFACEMPKNNSLIFLFVWLQDSRLESYYILMKLGIYTWKVKVKFLSFENFGNDSQT